MIRIGGQIVRPDGIAPGFLEVAGPTIRTIEPSDGAGEDIIVPGFVDLHCHGGGGHTFTSGQADAARAAAAFHLRHGTTTLLAGLVSSPHQLVRDALTAFGPLIAEGVLAGVFAEGPYLSGARCGAQNPAHLRDPSRAELHELLDLGGLRMMTIAPELPGALEAITLLHDRGVLAAVGHTDATFEQTQDSVRAGASVATHLFNGMPPVHHREPGPVLGLLHSTAVCELIADGVHLHPGTLAFAAATAGPHRTALITDAIDATGMPDGHYELGGQHVIVTNRVARLATNGSIAGSTLTMDAALRNAVQAGIALPDAVTMAATTPARTLGLGNQLGALHPGLRADLVVLDPALQIKQVMRAGTWV